MDHLVTEILPFKGALTFGFRPLIIPGFFQPHLVMYRQAKPSPPPQYPPGKEKTCKPKLFFATAILPIVGVSVVFASDIAERAEETLRLLNEAINQAEGTTGGHYSRDELVKDVEASVRMELKAEDEGNIAIDQLRERIQGMQKDIARQTSGDPAHSQDTIRTLMEKQKEVNRLKAELKELEDSRGIESGSSIIGSTQVQKLQNYYDKLIYDRNQIQKELFDLQKEHDKEYQKLRKYFEQQYLARINSDQAVISAAPESNLPNTSHPLGDIKEPHVTVKPSVIDDLETFLRQQGAISSDNIAPHGSPPMPPKPLPTVPSDNALSSTGQRISPKAPPETAAATRSRAAETLPGSLAGKPGMTPLVEAPKIIPLPSAPGVKQAPKATGTAAAPSPLSIALPVEPVASATEVVPLAPEPGSSPAKEILTLPPSTVKPDPAMALVFTQALEASDPDVDVTVELPPSIEAVVAPHQPAPVAETAVKSPAQSSSSSSQSPAFATTTRKPPVKEAVEALEPKEEPVIIAEEPAPVPVSPSVPYAPVEVVPVSTASGVFANLQLLSPVQPEKVSWPASLPATAQGMQSPIPLKPLPQAHTSDQDVYLPSMVDVVLPVENAKVDLPSSIEPSPLRPLDTRAESAPALVVNSVPSIESSPDGQTADRIPLPPAASLPKNESLVEIPLPPAPIEHLPKPKPVVDPVQEPVVLSSAPSALLKDKPEPVSVVTAVEELAPALPHTDLHPASLAYVDVVEPIQEEDDPLKSLLASSASATSSAPHKESPVSIQKIRAFPETAPAPSVELPAQPEEALSPEDGSDFSFFETPASPAKAPPPSVELPAQPEEALSPEDGSDFSFFETPASPAKAPAPSVELPAQPEEALSPEDGSDFSFFDTPTSPAKALASDVARQAIAPAHAAEEAETLFATDVHTPVSAAVPQPSISETASPTLNLPPSKAEEEGHSSFAPTTAFPFFLNDSLPSSLEHYDIPSVKPKQDIPEPTVPSSQDVPQPIESYSVVEEGHGLTDPAPAVQELVKPREPELTLPSPKIHRTPPPPSSTVILQIKADVELLSGEQSRGDNVHPAGYTEFYITSSSFNEIILGSSELKENMDKAMVGKNLSSYAELWARANKYGYNYPGLTSHIRKILREKGIHRVRTNANGEAKLRVPKSLAENEEQTELYIIGVSRLGQVGVVWSKPFFIQDHAGHDNPLHLEDLDALWLQ
jgi:hypothetical protein